MKYLAAHFEIACMDDMMQIARDLLMDVAGEAGFESFEDTERGVDGYVQEQLFDRQLLEDGIASFPLDGVSIVYNINKVEDQDWNAVWEEQALSLSTSTIAWWSMTPRARCPSTMLAP